jgi:hypothetical protein
MKILDDTDGLLAVEREPHLAVVLDSAPGDRFKLTLLNSGGEVLEVAEYPTLPLALRTMADILEGAPK